MYSVTLISQPGDLDAALPDSLRNAWGGGVIDWLAPDEAATFAVTERPVNLWQVWDDLQQLAVDLVLREGPLRKQRMLLADMDSTMIKQECIDELADVAGAGDAVRAVTARAMNGELDFEEALQARVGQLKGLPVDAIDTVIADRITFAEGGGTLLATMKAHGAYAALVSGGFTAFTGYVAETLGFDEHRANTLEIDGGHLAGTVATPILGREAKVSALQDITARLGIGATDVLAVGDGANDLGMLHAAGMGVALHAKPSVAAEVDIRINHGDLTALLYLQGYTKAEFVAP